MVLIVKHAYDNIPFYKKFYDKNNLNPHRDLNIFEDISNIPIIRKNDIINVPLKERSVYSNNVMKANTGGSSGKPLSFYLPSHKMGIEWSHLHYIWKRQCQYSPKDLKVLMVGRGNVENHVCYDFIRNVLRFDIFSNYDEISKIYLSKFSKYKIKYLRGYPSSIYELALHCEKNIVFRNEISKDLKGVFLISEFPNNQMRLFIEKIFNVKTFSFYGHSEGCIIAYEKDVKERFHPLHSYGFCETETIDNTRFLPIQIIIIIIQTKLYITQRTLSIMFI